MAKKKKGLDLDNLDFSGVQDIDKLDFSGIAEMDQPKTVPEVLSEKASGAIENVADTGASIGEDLLVGASDLGRGITQGVTLGGFDEGVAGVKALIGKYGRGEKEDLKELYRKYHEIEQQKLQAAEERSPGLMLTGEIAGGILPALATGGASLLASGARVAGKQAGKSILKKAATVGAGQAALGGVMGGLTSEEGKLIGSTPEEKQKLGADVLGGMATGTVLGAGLSVASDVLAPVGKKMAQKGKEVISDFIDDSHFFRQIKKSAEIGEEGINISSEKAKFGKAGQDALLSKDTDSARDLVERIYTVDEALGKEVGKAIDGATTSGQTINLTDELYDTAKNFVNLYNQDATIAANPRAKKLYEQIFKLQKENLTPREIQTLRDNVVDFSDSIKLKDPYLAQLGYEFQANIGRELKTQVPAYKEAAERFERFRTLVPETLISGGVPVDMSGVKLGKLKNQDAKLFTSAKNMIQGATRPGSASQEEGETLVNLMHGLKQFDELEKQKLAQGLIKEPVLPKMGVSSPKELEKMLMDKADQSAILQQIWQVSPNPGIGRMAKGSVAGLAETGRGTAMSIANKFGLHKQSLAKIKAPYKLSKELYKAADHELMAVADKLSEMPGVGSLGKALKKGLENKDIAARNAAIFAIMQNPQARMLISAEDIENKEQSEEE